MVIIGAGPPTSLAEWQKQRFSSGKAADTSGAKGTTPFSATASSGISSAPLTPMDHEASGIQD